MLDGIAAQAGTAKIPVDFTGPVQLWPATT
jgi:hypothetical protein